MKAALIIISLCGSAAHAVGGRALVPRIQVQSAPGAIPKYVGGINLSLRQKPLFASHLMASVDSLTSRIDTRSLASADFLREEILGRGPGAISVAQLKESLGSQALPANQAAALLVANALAQPRDFSSVLGRLDEMKPGLGRRVSESLQALGVRINPTPPSALYLRDGKLDPFFSIETVPEDNPLRQ